MDLRIKIAKPGEEIFCEYTGEQATVLVKLANESNESCWLGQQALQQALATLVSLTGNRFQAPPSPPPQQYAYAGVANLPMSESLPVQGEPAVAGKKSGGGLSTRDKEWLAAFQTDCLKIAQNPSPNAKGEVTGVSELQIREIISQWKSRFNDPTCMAPVIQKVFGMSRDRFDTLLEFC